MRLVPDWHKAWTWFSVQALAIVAVLPLVWLGMPPDVKAWVPEAWHIWIFVGLGISGIAGRVIDQNPKPSA